MYYKKPINVLNIDTSNQNYTSLNLIYNVGIIPSLAHHYHKFSLSDLCPRV